MNASDTNFVMLQGVLAEQPINRQAESGSRVCNFRLKSTRTFNRSDGTPGSASVYIDVEAWQEQADVAASLLVNSSICVAGRLKWSSGNGDGQGRIAIRAHSVLPISRQVPASVPNVSQNVGLPYPTQQYSAPAQVAPLPPPPPPNLPPNLPDNRVQHVPQVLGPDLGAANSPTTNNPVQPQTGGTAK